MAVLLRISFCVHGGGKLLKPNIFRGAHHRCVMNSKTATSETWDRSRPTKDTFVPKVEFLNIVFYIFLQMTQSPWPSPLIPLNYHSSTTSSSSHGDVSCLGGFRCVSLRHNKYNKQTNVLLFPLWHTEQLGDKNNLLLYPMGKKGNKEPLRFLICPPPPVNFWPLVTDAAAAEQHTTLWFAG